MRRRGPFFLFLVLLTCTSAWAQLRGLIRHPDASRTIVNNYCRMDYEGFRLLKDSWPRMKPLTTWKENPEWQGFTVVSQYDVVSANEGLHSASVQVQYAVLGRFRTGLGYLAERGDEEVSFRLRDVDSSWKIEDMDPFINPHVSRARAIAWLKSALAAEKDAVNKVSMERALKDLGANP
jgi:hypothetical protein